ncbi:transporter substrate-binding domain-containing protein [Shewanella indica]|uniref:substrate-binding periplasmic protein n=1 Tax=Shewanella indica TaxID=768528 RepID=UPI001F2C822C|nr:transporter substrate-binding domain-containing protein [Shewanella indica]MCE9791528.1 transporter substrate-binding domain-containing protein [Shewanella indica]
MKFTLYPFAAFLTVMLISPVSNAKDELNGIPLKICVEESEFPPFNYFSRIDGRKSHNSDGYDIQLLYRLFTPPRWQLHIIALPWPRCMLEVELGKIDAAMSASANPERRRKFLLSRSYYHLTPGVVFLKQSFPKGLRFNSLTELTRIGTVCGIRGFNYHHFGWNNSLPLSLSKDLPLIPELLQRGRCDFFLARLEVFSGTLKLMKRNPQDFGLATQAVPHTRPEPFYMLVSRQSPHKMALLEEFNSGVTLLEKSGELQLLLQAFTDH